LARWAKIANVKNLHISLAVIFFLLGIFSSFPTILQMSEVSSLAAFLLHLVSASIFCGIFDVSGHDNAFVWCGPDVRYLKTPMVLIAFYLPALIFAGLAYRAGKKG